MIKRYCDRCGQQIDEGVHAWYVLELHDTDGEFRHKELCEECYELLAEDKYIPRIEQTEPQTEADWKDQMWTEAVEASKTEPQTMVYPQVDGITPSVIEPQTCDTCRHWKCIAKEFQCETTKCQGYEPIEPQTERNE